MQTIHFLVEENLWDTACNHHYKRKRGTIARTTNVRKVTCYLCKRTIAYKKSAGLLPLPWDVGTLVKWMNEQES